MLLGLFSRLAHCLSSARSAKTSGRQRTASSDSTPRYRSVSVPLIRFCKRGGYAVPRNLKSTPIALILCVLAVALTARASEQDAVAISANIQQRHLPNGTIVDPVFASAATQNIVGYTRGGDSALW